MPDFLRAARARNVAAPALAMAFAVVAWQQWLHTSVLRSHEAHDGNAIVHWFRDGALTVVPVVPAVLAVMVGLAIARRRQDDASSVFGQLPRPAWMALVFGALLVPMARAHGWCAFTARQRAWRRWWTGIHPSGPRRRLPLGEPSAGVKKFALLVVNPSCASA